MGTQRGGRACAGSTGKRAIGQAGTSDGRVSVRNFDGCRLDAPHSLIGPVTYIKPTDDCDNVGKRKDDNYNQQPSVVIRVVWIKSRENRNPAKKQRKIDGSGRKKENCDRQKQLEERVEPATYCRTALIFL